MKHQYSSPTSPAALGRKYLGGLLAGLFLFRFVLNAVSLAGMIPIQSDLTFPEGALVARAIDVAHGESPYHDWRQWPHHFAPYPPLAYYPVGWLTRALDGATAPHVVYMAGRLFCYTMMLGLFAVTCLLARRLGLPWGWSLCVVALLPEFLPLMVYGISFRPDAPKALFALAALGIASRGRATPRAAAAALGCLLVSFWFKPTAWAVGAAIAWWGWRGLGPRRALAAGALFLAAGLVPLWGLNRHWHGLLMLNIVDSLRNGLELKTLLVNLKNINFTPLLLMAGGALAGAAAWRRAEEPGARLILAMAPISLLVCLVQLLKVGADVNYFLDSYPLTVLAAAWFVRRLWVGEPGLGVRWRLGLGCPAALLLLVLVYHAVLDVASFRDGFALLTESWPRLPAQEFARQAPGPLLAVNSFVALESPAPTILDHFQYRVLCSRGAIDPEGLLARVRARQFSAIILRNTATDATNPPDGGDVFFCKGFLPTAARYYRDQRTSGIYQVFRLSPEDQAEARR